MASLLHAVRDGVLTRRPFAQQEWGNRSSELFIVGRAQRHIWRLPGYQRHPKPFSLFLRKQNPIWRNAIPYRPPSGGQRFVSRKG